MGALLGIVAITVAGYAVLVAVSPMCRCPRCKGRKVAQGRRGARPCGRCKGTSMARRRGARFVHRVIRGWRQR
jgi:hypothetical protein